jgi:hypothetical protein
MAGHRRWSDQSIQGPAESCLRYVIACLHIFLHAQKRKDWLTAVAVRKALQDSLQEDEGEDDDDEQRYLNLNEEEGDVWDDNSAYIEMLAKEVRASALPPRLGCAGTHSCLVCRVNACAR